jgi:hypothetical protein
MADNVESEQPRTLWNSLEKTKIVIGALTPLAIFVLGYAVSYESAQRSQRSDCIKRILDRRYEVWNILNTKLVTVQGHLSALLAQAHETNPRQNLVREKASAVMTALTELQETAIVNKLFFSEGLYQAIEAKIASTFKVAEYLFQHPAESRSPELLSRLKTQDDRHLAMLRSVQMDLAGELPIESDCGNR